jgi:hypothetical protein
MKRATSSKVKRIARLIRADRHEEAIAAMSSFSTMAWADWCYLCQAVFDHQDCPSPAQASGSRKTEGDR